MLSRKPPIRIICPGRVFRNDNDLRHSPMFHQVEGLAVAEGITVGHLKGDDPRLHAPALLAEDGDPHAAQLLPLHRALGEVGPSPARTARARGARSARGTGWMEILGCGMVDPRVLHNCGIDPDVYSGFAFGMGVDRVAMNRYGIPNIRLLFDNDERLLRQVRG